MSYIGNQPAPTNIPIANLEGVTATNTELNFVDGVTSAIQTQVDAKQPYATIAVTVVDSGGNKYALDGTVQQLGLLTPSVTYRFDQSDSSNSGHPLLLSTTSNGTHGGGSAFTTGVTAVGTPGNAGAYTQVKLEQDAPDTLYYYCSSHSGMGGEVDVRATVSSLSDLSVTSTAAELNILDGVTSTAAELNILDGVTSTAAELNILDGVTSTTAELNILDGVTSTAAELNILDGVTSTASELNLLDGDTSVGGSITIADSDGVVVNDGGTMKTVPASDFKTLVGASAGGFSIANLDIDGGTDIGEAIVDADLFIVDNGAGGTNRKVAASRLVTYIDANSSAASVGKAIAMAIVFG